MTSETRYSVASRVFQVVWMHKMYLGFIFIFFSQKQGTSSKLTARLAIYVSVNVMFAVQGPTIYICMCTYICTQ